MDAPWGSGVKGWEWAGLGVGAQTSSGGHADSGTTCCKAPRGRRKTAPWRPGNKQGFALQIQCYQCEEFQLNNDCSSPEFIVNCTVNVQDMCQKEVMEQSAAERESKRGLDVYKIICHLFLGERNEKVSTANIFSSLALLNFTKI
ncbi:ly6/PLAUR domain-containing protein 1 isoform X2 [Heterocephalus glaber]|uniref:Ly6/PLAUR domain-containing protein 1 isoform X2 n=1 Tax=Heterocephalus glaber TaxID=10181 RepID=A0AAX6R856_HETGA|nr:ly6/PLAUR domain-containing protein 1 isoform X2 [Heterocephalus glaber]